MAQIQRLSRRQQLLTSLRLVQLSMPDEIKALRIKRVLFSASCLYFGPALSNYLYSRSILPSGSTNVDIFKSMRLLIEKCNHDSDFLQYNHFDIHHLLETAMLGRNAVAHGWLPLLLLEGRMYLLSWVRLCTLINATSAARQLQNIYDTLFRSNHAPTGDPVDASELFEVPHFARRLNHQQSGAMPTGDYQRALVIMVNMFGCLCQFLWPALRKYLISEERCQAFENSSLDPQAFLQEMLRLRMTANQRTPSTKADLKKLRIAVEGRNAVCHGKMRKLYNSFEKYLTSWVEVCKLVNNTAAADRIEAVLTKLKGG